MARRLIYGLMDLFFPPKCIFCRKLLRGRERFICDTCKKDLPYTDLAQAVSPGEYFSKCVSPLLYTGHVVQSFHRFKFSAQTNYAGPYGQLMAGCVQQHFDGGYDLITWVPLSPRRKKKRGYDQAMLLAMATALELGDVAVETLRKRGEIPAQSGLERPAERKTNVIGAFEVSSPDLVCGKRILLIDDIVTTGATLSECSRMLLEAGAKDVICVTLARTIHSRDPAKRG
ncbi:MAG: ComF family protein [Oscillospiraceae bacterium]|nr:ComF family protein [Oscillospiraceae bacterium]